MSDDDDDDDNENRSRCKLTKNHTNKSIYE